MAGRIDVLTDQIKMRHVVFPPSGDNERFRIAYPAKAQYTPTNLGPGIISANPDKGALLTLTTFPGEPADVLALSLIVQNTLDNATRQTGVTPGRWSGQAKTSSEVVSWSGAQLIQTSDTVSLQTRSTVTHTYQLLGVARIPVPQ